MIARLLRFCLAAVLCSTISSRAAAQTAIEKALETRDVSALEANITAMMTNAAEDKAQKESRAAIHLFATTSPEIDQVLLDWAAAVPDSDALKVAKARAMFHRMWILRGTDYARYVGGERPTIIRIIVDTQSQVLEDLYEKYPSFLPISDLLFQLHQYRGNQEAAERLIYEVLESQPNYPSLGGAQGTLRPEWGGSYERILALCDHYAEQALEKVNPIDFCKVDAIYGYSGLRTGTEPSPDGHSTPLGWANQVLERMPLEWHPFAQLWRISAIPRDPQVGPDRIMALMTSLTLGGKKTLHENGVLKKLAQTYDMEPFFEAQIAGLDNTDKRLAFDPMNPGLIEDWYWANNRKYQTDDQFDKTHALLRRLSGYGAYLPETWVFLAKIQPSTQPSIKRKFDYHERAVVYSNHNPYRLSDYLRHALIWYRNMEISLERGETDHLGGEFDPTEQLEALECPLVRATYLMNLACQSASPDVSEAYVCKLDSWPMRSVLEVLTETNPEEICPSFDLSTELDVWMALEPDAAGAEEAMAAAIEGFIDRRIRERASQPEVIALAKDDAFFRALNETLRTDYVALASQLQDMALWEHLGARLQTCFRKDAGVSLGNDAAIGMANGLINELMAMSGERWEYEAFLSQTWPAHLNAIVEAYAELKPDATAEKEEFVAAVDFMEKNRAFPLECLAQGLR